MKVSLFPADNFGCGFYRMREPARVVADLGVETEIRDGLDAVCRQSRDGQFEKIEQVEELDCDVVVLQRPTRPMWIQAIPLIQKQGVAVVVEVDDDLTSIPPSNPAWHTLHPRSDSPESWSAVSECVRLADLVTVATPDLQKVYGGVVLENCIPKEVLELGPDLPKDHSIGWAGAGEFHRGDFKDCGGAVATVVRESGEPMSIGANNAGEVASWLGITDWRMTDYWTVPVGEHYQGLDFQIGIVPLEQNAFNQSKSWLKGLEYAAMGIPFVATPTAAYRDWFSMSGGACLLADRPRVWLAQLRHLHQNAGLREELTGLGREMAKKWTFEDHAPRWEEAWQQAITARGKARSRTFPAAPTGRAVVK